MGARSARGARPVRNQQRINHHILKKITVKMFNVLFYGEIEKQRQNKQNKTKQKQDAKKKEKKEEDKNNKNNKIKDAGPTEQ